MELSLTLSQKLALSQKMQQSAEILQMSSQELAEYVKEFSVENPVVEFEEKKDEESRFDSIRKKIEWLDASDEQNKTYYQEEKEDETDNDMWKFKQTQGESLEDFLLSQINVLPMSAKRLSIAHYIVESMDRNGYLEESEEVFAKRLHIDTVLFQEVLSVVQGLEPAGIGAFSLKQCLLLQLHKMEQPCPLAEKIIENELEALGKNQIPQIAKRLKVKTQEVVEACKLIRSFNPKPGSSFKSDENLEYIVPDVLIEKDKNGIFQIILNNEYLPQIRINPYYKTIMKEAENDKAKEYVSNKMKQAEWVVQCITKRNETLTKTMHVILEMQKDFFEKGTDYLCPMRLCDVAQKIQMHESTVSRTVRDKYLQCSWGVFALHQFFSTGLATSNEANKVTPEHVKRMIKTIIDEENKQSPLSDRIISEVLKEKGIEISRRTVTKYRESMNIAGISGRKSF